MKKNMTTVNKNEILLLLTGRWCDWEASYVVAVVNSFSYFVIKIIAIDFITKYLWTGLKLTLIIALTTIKRRLQCKYYTMTTISFKNCTKIEKNFNIMAKNIKIPTFK